VREEKTEAAQQTETEQGKQIETIGALRAFGLSLLVETDGQPPGAWEQPRPSAEPSLRIRSANAPEIAERWSGLQTVGWQGVIDGAPFVVQRGVAGDHRFLHGAPPDQSGVSTDETRAIHHLSADAAVLRCAPSDPANPAWWRVVLDSVLFTVALLRGYEALHAGAIAMSGGSGAIAITAASGGGKSTLLAELLGRGEPLLADDVVVLESRGAEAPLAHPAAPLMTVPAVRVPALLGTVGTPQAPQTLQAQQTPQTQQTLQAQQAPQSAQTICAIDDEQWIAVPVHPDPLPLRALVVLDRRPASQLPEPESGPSLQRIADPLAPLLGSLMAFPTSPERQRARFELASVLAATTALWRLTADLATPPDALADTLLAGTL
jgi:hypothetical protein